MAEFRHDKATGETFIFDEPTQTWRGAKQLEINIARAGAVGQGLAAAQGATGIPGIISPELGQGLSAVNPIAETVGIAGALGGGLAKPAVGLAQRVFARSGAAQAAKQAPTQGVRKALMTDQGFRRNPDELLPDAAQGAGRIVRSGLETIPVTRLMTDFLIRNPNQRNLNKLAGRAIGATDQEIAQAGGKLTPQVLAAADERVGTMFRTVAENIGKNIDEDAALQAALKANSEGLISNTTLNQIVKGQDDFGESLMNLRSDLLANARSAGSIEAKNKLDDSIEAIDDIIKEALKDDEPTRRLFVEARARYRASVALFKGKALGNTDDANAASLFTAMKSVYGREFRKGSSPTGAPADVSNFLEGVREAQAVNVGVPSSGTAERLLAASLIGGGVGGSLQ